MDRSRNLENRERRGMRNLAVIAALLAIQMEMAHTAAASELESPTASPASSSSASSPGAAPSSTPEGTPAVSSTTPAAMAKLQGLLDTKRYAEALVEVELLLKSDAKNPELLTSKGYALRETGKLKEAVESYLDALKVNPQLHATKGSLAITYLRMGEVKPAKQLIAELKKDAPRIAKLVRAEALQLKLKL